METVASAKTPTARLSELESHVAMVTQQLRTDWATQLAWKAIYHCAENYMRSAMSHVQALAFESALFWLLEGDPATVRRQMKSWAALDSGPALQERVAQMRRWLDPEHDYDIGFGDIEDTRRQLAAAEAIVADRDRAEAEALAAS